MENESSRTEKSTFIKKFGLIQNVVEAVVFIAWLAATIFVVIFGTKSWRNIFEVASAGLLGISLFNIIAMVGFAVWGQRRFSVPRFLLSIATGAMALIGLVFSFFAQGIKIQ